MSSKFFTWTKGDRRVAQDALRSGGVVPIPIECIAIKGMDYSRSAQCKEKRKPLPLVLDSASSISSKHSSRTNDSIALQDAAVQSATNLIAVMNDVLRSPHLSAHLHAQNTLNVPAGRQRSYTAPTTPRADILRHPTMAELPGSIPNSRACSIDDQSTRLHLHEHNSRNDLVLERPCSSPQEIMHGCYSPQRRSSESAPARTEMMSAFSSPRPRTTSPDEATPRKVRSRSTTAESQTRHSLPIPRPQISSHSSAASSIPTTSGSRAVSLATYTDDRSTPLLQKIQDDSEAALMQQIAVMRASHEAHVASLKEAHEREIEAQRNYISFLERRRTVPSTPQTSHMRQHLTIDTSNAGHGSELLVSDGSATSYGSNESLESHRRASQEAIAEVEALKRKLSVLRRTQVDTTELKRERDELREYAGRCDRRIIQLKDIIRKTKESEKALKNAGTDLEARLEAANIQRIDLLEGLEVAFADVRKISGRERALVSEVNDLRRRISSKMPRHASDSILLQPAVSRELALGTEKEAVTTKNNDALLEQIEDLRNELQSRDLQLEQMKIESVAEKSPREKSRLMELEATLTDFKAQLSNAKADCDRYNNLLHNEIRRQSRTASRKSQIVAPEIEAQATAAAAERIRSTISVDNGTKQHNFEEAIQLLEKELEYCTKEIIMYKLDVKGYKKDLKHARAEIDGLKTLTRCQRPPTPDLSVTRSSTNVKNDRTTSQSGLGILMPVRVPSTPTRPPTSTRSTTSGAKYRKPPPMTTSIEPLSPKSTSAPRTPTTSSDLSTNSSSKDKALPRLPPTAPPSSSSSSNNPTAAISFTPPPPPPLPAHSPISTPNLQRGATFRSLSESIISSYANRSTPEQQPHPHPLLSSPAENVLIGSAEVGPRRRKYERKVGGRGKGMGSGGGRGGEGGGEGVGVVWGRGEIAVAM